MGGRGLRVSARRNRSLASFFRPQAVLQGCAETVVVVADRDPILIAGRVGARGAGREFAGCWGSRVRVSAGLEGWARDGVCIRGMSGNQKCPFSVLLLGRKEMRWLGDCTLCSLVVRRVYIGADDACAILGFCASPSVSQNRTGGTFSACAARYAL